MTRLLILNILIIVTTMFPQNNQPLLHGRDDNKVNLLSFSDSAFNGMRWRLVGPFRGGRALAAAGIPGNSTTFYFGAVDGGVWKTTNSGLTWDQISDGKTNPSIGALAIASSDDKTLYIGTGEADMRSDITYGDGVYKSTDSGIHWKNIGLTDSRHIGKILIDPRNPDIVLVAALGHAYGSNEERGVFKTTDGGKSWKKVLYKNAETGAIDLSWDSKYPKIIYASLWQAKRTPWSQYPPDEGPGSGLYKSTDEGNTWSEIIGKGLPQKQLGRIGIAVAIGSKGEIVYALVESNSKESGLYYSDNGGKNWILKNNEPNIITRMWYFGEIFIDPINSNIVYIPNRSLLRSDDGGKTFSIIKGA
ncbi:MAG: WD40/YVTN/BNR-like repeat-containing protein, partial [Ignavibacteriaceae bacterium]